MKNASNASLLEEDLLAKMIDAPAKVEKKIVYVITFPKDSHHKNHSTIDMVVVRFFNDSLIFLK